MFNSIAQKIHSRLGQRGAIFGLAALDLVEKDPKIIFLTADLADLSGMDRLRKKYPENFVNVGIAEQNLIGISAGMASEGFKPVATTYATFITLRSCEQIRHYLGYMGLKVVVIGSGAGFIQEFSGNTHYAIEDIAVMRSIPNMVVLSPSDASQAILALESALQIDAPVYIRLTGGLGCPVIHEKEYEFKLGRPITICEGSDITIFATGLMVNAALKAAELLAKEKISVGVVDVHTIKPMPDDICSLALVPSMYVTIEEHNIIGGLGGAISEKLADAGSAVPLLRLGVKDCFSTVGDYEYLLSVNRLLPDQIAQDIKTKFEVIGARNC